MPNQLGCQDNMHKQGLSWAPGPFGKSNRICKESQSSTDVEVTTSA